VALQSSNTLRLFFCGKFTECLPGTTLDAILYSRVLKILHFMRGPTLCSTVIYYAATIVLLLVITLNPLLRDDHDTHIQDIIPTRVSIKRLINPLQRIMNENPHKLMEITGANKDKKVYTYIRDDIFHEDKIDSISTDKVSPFHKATLLMGCYGDLWSKHEKAPSVLAGVVGESYQKPFMVNLILQALDDRYAQSSPGLRGWDGATHDKSACDCMRDFASPSFVHVMKDAKCDSKYQQDSCAVQNTLDYALDGKSTGTNGSSFELQRMSLLVDMNRADVRVRNRHDPMMTEYQTFFTAENFNVNDLLTTKPELKKFIDNYCLVAGYREIISSIQDEKQFDKYEHEYNRKCPKSWSDPALFPNVKIGSALQFITECIAEMHAHNKLRTPTLTSGATKSDVYPPEIDREGYKMYLHKYKAAFETCAHAGVPQYVARVTNYTTATHWHVAGELLLLLAASVAFFWAWVIKRMQPSNPKPQDEERHFFLNSMHWADDFLCYISVGFPVLLAVLGIWRISEFSRREFLDHQESKALTEPAQQSEFLAVFVLLWWVLYIALCGIIVLLIVFIIRRTRHLFSFFGKYTQIERKDGAELTTDYSDLNQLAFGAQIAIDVPVIVGLTFIAVGTTMQQGVSDYYVILTVIVFFTLIGLTTHITNVLRLMHLIAQWEIVNNRDNNSESKHVEAIKYNRVAIGVLIALMLYTYLYLAGMDSYQGQSYGAQHQTIFAFVAFLILCVGDLTLEFLCLFQRSEPYPSQSHYFYDIIFKKTRNTVWIILLSIFVLNVHLHFVLCQRPAPLEGRADACTWWLSKA
jgi:hypothetical protein